MEKSLKDLSQEQINTRVAADFCCLWRYDYPTRVYEICEIIGGGPHTALRLHYQICPIKRQEFMDYAAAMIGWLRDTPPDDRRYFRKGSEDTTKKIYNFLGSRDPVKNLLVERTHLGLSLRYLNCSFWGTNERDPSTPLMPYTADQLDDDAFRRFSELENVILAQMGPDSGSFLCDVGGSAEPACHFKFLRRVDILLSSIGCMKWRGNLPPKAGNIRGRRQITALFLDNLESYWRGKRREISGDEADLLNSKLNSLLGKPDDFKRWAVASLWKNMKNQTTYQSFPMNRWVELVQTGESYLDTI